MQPAGTIDSQADLLSAVLDVLRQHGHVVQVITLTAEGHIELRLDPASSAQAPNPLDLWRAQKRHRNRGR